MATTLGLHPSHITHALIFDVMHIAFHSYNINSMASGINPWHVLYLPASERDSTSSLVMMWDSALEQNTHITMDKWKQVLRNFKTFPPCHWQDAAITIQHWIVLLAVLLGPSHPLVQDLVALCDD
eukprot:12157861-Ditylum_brightwellii.AAC.1